MSSILIQGDVAFVVLMLFFAFFLGLVFYLRREDRREGYPLEEDGNAKALRHPGGFLFFPDPKTWVLPHNRGTYTAPKPQREDRPLAARRSVVPGSPLIPTGNPMADGIGPGAFAQRRKEPDLDFHGHPKIRPARLLPDVSVARGEPDPRGMTVFGCDGAAAGKISEMWVDRPESMIRYLEVALTAGGSVLLPMTMVLIDGLRRVVKVDAITGAQFAGVPRLASGDQITFDEEERICAYYGGGFLYATPDRAEPLL